MSEEKETRDYTTGLTLIPCKSERATVIWVRNCRSCGREFKTDNKKQWVCDACTKTYEFKIGRLALAKQEETAVPLNELRLCDKS